MSNSIFLLGVILISRLVFTFEDGPIDKTRTILMTVLQIMEKSMVYQIQFTLGALGITLLAINVAFYFLENRTRRASESRLLSLLAHVTILSIFFSPWDKPKFQSWTFHSSTNHRTVFTSFHRHGTYRLAQFKYHITWTPVCY